MDLSVLMVCVIWTVSLKAHEMQPGPLGGGGGLHAYVCIGEGKCLKSLRGVGELQKNIKLRKH